MATRKSTATTRKSAPVESNGLTFAEVAEEDFPTQKRVSTKLEHLYPIAQQLADGAKGTLNVADKEEGAKIAGQLRQILRFKHGLALSAPYIDGVQYIRANGEYKERGPRQKKEEVAPEVKATARKTVAKSRDSRR